LSSPKVTTGQLSLIGVVVVLLVALTWFGINFKTATYDKPIEIPKNENASKADIFSLLHRFAGSNEKLNTQVENIEKDSLNPEYIDALEASGTSSRIPVFNAYALYLKGIIKSSSQLLQESADMFFEAGTHDPDSMADRTTYSVYSIRACDRILKNDPSNKAALTTKATCLVYFEGAVMAGVGLLKEVESMDSNYVDAQHHLMLLAIQSGQYEKAKIRLKKLLSLQPDNQQYADMLLNLETQQLK